MSRFQWLEMEAEPGAADIQTPTANGFSVEYYIREAEKKFYAGERESSLKLYARALREDRFRAEAWVGQAWILFLNDEAEEAVLWTDKGLEAIPDSPGLLAAKALALARCGRMKEAREFADGAVACKEAPPIIWLARGYILLQDGSSNADYALVKYLEAGLDPAKANEKAELTISK